jgi:hypothetical protein
MSAILDLQMREIRALLRSVENDLQTRRDHPSYGVTKGGIREKLALAEGALRALAIGEGRLEHFQLGTALLERDYVDDQLYALAQKRIALSHELKRS